MEYFLCVEYMILLFFVIESFLSNTLKSSLQLENELHDTQTLRCDPHFFFGRKVLVYKRTLFYVQVNWDKKTLPQTSAHLFS